MTPVWRPARRTNPRFAAWLGALFGLSATSAPAATLQAQPDGTLLLTVLGERAVIPQEYADRVFVFGRDNKSCVEDDHHPRFELAKEPPESLQNSLQRWLVDPVKAKCFESLAPTEKVNGKGGLVITFAPDKWGSFSLPNLLELDFPQAGKQTKAIPLSPMGLHFGDPLDNLKDYCTSIDENDQIDANGYRRKWLGPDSPVYLRAVNLNGARMCISCYQITSWICGETLPANNAGVRLVVQWYQDENSSLPAWSVIDAAARRLLKKVLPYRNEGD